MAEGVLLTKKKWCRDWEMYSLLLQESLQEGDSFNKKEQLAEVKARLEQYYRDVIRGNCSRAAVINKAERLNCLANKYNAGEEILREDYEKAYHGFGM